MAAEAIPAGGAEDTLVAEPEGAPAPEAAAAENKKADKKKADKKGEKGGKAAPAGAPDGAPTIAAHPRAVRSIAQAKSWAGLLGFLIAGYTSMSTSTLAGIGLRALIGGVVGYVAVWGAAVFIWRRLVILEIKAREQELAALLQKAAVGRLGGGAAGGAGARDAP